MHYQVSVAGQQAELQRVLRDDEQKEATVDLRKPGGETEQIVVMHNIDFRIRFFCVCLSLFKPAKYDLLIVPLFNGSSQAGAGESASKTGEQRCDRICGLYYQNGGTNCVVVMILFWPWTLNLLIAVGRKKLWLVRENIWRNIQERLPGNIPWNDCWWSLPHTLLHNLFHTPLFICRKAIPRNFCSFFIRPFLANCLIWTMLGMGQETNKNDRPGDDGTLRSV